MSVLQSFQALEKYDRLYLFLQQSFSSKKIDDSKDIEQLNQNGGSKINKIEVKLKKLELVNRIIQIATENEILNNKLNKLISYVLVKIPAHRPI